VSIYINNTLSLLEVCESNVFVSLFNVAKRLINKTKIYFTFILLMGVFKTVCQNGNTSYLLTDQRSSPSGYQERHTCAGETKSV